MASPTQRALARELSAELDEASPSARPLRSVVAQLSRLLHADQACACLVRVDGRRKSLDFFHEQGMAAGIGEAYARWLDSAPADFANYDPASPDVAQRNQPLTSAEVVAMTGRVAPVTRQFLPRFSLGQADQLRVLVCEESSLLAWVGAFRSQPFSPRDRDALAMIVPALQRRLALERRLREAQVVAREIGAALESVPAAAFIVLARGRVVHANAAGRALLDGGRAEIESRLAAALRRRTGDVQLARLSPELTLAILPAPANPEPLVARARLRWELTPRQEQVLRLVGKGMSNHAIAAELGCADSTVELHVTALLEKSESENRAHLVAKLWGGG